MAVELDGALACVTGGARGIGRATAAELASRGAKVWIGDIDEEAAAEAAVGLGKEVRSKRLDVTDADSFSGFLRAAEETDGPLAVLVNNAGIMPLGRFLEQDPALGERVLQINFGGVVNGMRLALPGMVRRGSGHIANVASLMAKLAVPGAAMYTGAKHAVLGFTDSVREEIVGSGVTLSTVMPSAVETELIAGIPQGRGLPVVKPEDVAKAIADSCGNGRHDVYVPRWAGGAGLADTVIPGRAMSGIRRLMRQERAIEEIDAAERRAYEERVEGS
jgi:NADP-dependent 3-hydroxy acid dehydrogenase YdfG